MRKNGTGSSGFTLIEIIIVVMLVGIMAILAFPNFIDIRPDAKDAATKGALGGLRSAVEMVQGLIALRENPANSPTAQPTTAEMAANLMSAAAPGNHVALAGTAVLNVSAGIPVNSWTGTATIHDCTGDAKGTLLAAPNNNDGWCYDSGTGTIWANSNLSTGPVKENLF